MFYVYVLKSLKNGELYIGFTEDLKKRFVQHNRGESSHTKKFKPWALVYYEAYKNKLDATKREANLKKNHRAKQDLKKQLENSLEV